MIKFLKFLQNTMPTPTSYGWFHIMWIVLTVLACVLIYIFRKRISTKGVNITLLLFGISLLIFEAYKQFVFSYSIVDEQIIWSYHWYAFPFQFCSTPMYLMILAGILRKGKVYNALLCYLATFAMFGGLVTAIYPEQVFISTIGINIQTMYWHCGMIVMAFLILATRSIKLNYKSLLSGAIVFIIMVSIALIMNIIFYHVNPEPTFNMFYISPYKPCTLPLVGIIYEKAPYVVFLIVYIIGFTLAATIILSLAILFDKVEKIIANKRLNKSKV